MYKAPSTKSAPFPDKFFTTLEVQLPGFLSAGVTGSVVAYGMNMLSLTYPYSAGGTYTAWPNPLSSVSTTNPTGLRNILYNSTAGTGLYQNYRVHGVDIEFWAMPQLAVDMINVALCPVNGASAVSAYSVVADAPYAKNKTMILGQVKENVIRYKFKPREFKGETKEQWRTDDSTLGTFASPPTDIITMGVYVIACQQSTNNTNVIPYNMKAKYFIEFFQPITTLLTQN